MSHTKEIWQPTKIQGKKTDLPLFVSNNGAYGIKKSNGEIDVKIRKIKHGNERVRIRVQKKQVVISLAKLIGEAFVKRTSSKQTMITHLDYDYTNNKPSNLKWVTPREHREHTKNSPNTLASIKNKAFTKSFTAKVLNEKQVIAIKKMIWDPKRKLSYKKLAEKYNVSEMQIYRIKSGELWFHIKVENEPLRAKYKQNLKNIALKEKQEAIQEKAKQKPKKKLTKKRTSLKSIIVRRKTKNKY